MTVSSAAEVLVRAAASARTLRGRVRVIKLGGSAMEDPAATRGTLESVVCLQTLGVRQVLVHGGGKPIDRAMAAAGLTPKKVAGRRYTDEVTLEIVVRVLNELNAGIVAQLTTLGGRAVAVSNLLAGERSQFPGSDLRPIDLGLVGRVTRLNAAGLANTLEDGNIPVSPSLIRNVEGDGWLNINADTVAFHLAGAVNADACLFLTDTPGVLRDIADPGSLFPKLTRVECQKLITDGVIAGGMIPKVEACFEALDAGAGRAVILDGRNPYALLGEFIGEPAGTEIVP